MVIGECSYQHSLQESFLTISSEAVMLGLLAAGVDPVLLLVYGSIGNVLGGMLN